MRQYILAVLLILVCSNSFCQKALICNETWFSSSSKTFRIITSDDKVAHFIMSKYENVMEKFTYTRKSDRKGYYWERSFYFKLPLADTIVKAIQINFK